MIINLTVTFIGSIPTFVSAWKNPAGEDRVAWTIFWTSCIFAMIAIPRMTLADAGQPITFLFIQTVMVSILYLTSPTRTCRIDFQNPFIKSPARNCAGFPTSILFYLQNLIRHLDPRSRDGNLIANLVLPKNALPNGDSSEIFPSSGFASYMPTMEYFEVLSPFLMVTMEPTSRRSPLSSVFSMHHGGLQYVFELKDATLYVCLLFARFSIFGILRKITVLFCLFKTLSNIVARTMCL